MTQPSGKPSKRSKANQVPEKEMMGDLAKCILDVLNADVQTDQEPFERYAHLLRVRLHAEEQTFCNHFIQGYEVLLEQLQPKSPQ